MKGRRQSRPLFRRAGHYHSLTLACNLGAVAPSGRPAALPGCFQLPLEREISMAGWGGTMWRALGGPLSHGVFSAFLHHGPSGAAVRPHPGPRRLLLNRRVTAWRQLSRCFRGYASYVLLSHPARNPANPEHRQSVASPCDSAPGGAARCQWA